MKTFLNLVLVLSGISLRGQGTIDFRNHVYSQVDAPVLDCMSTNRLSKPGYVAELFWASTNDFAPFWPATGEDLTPTTPAAVRYQGLAAGYWTSDTSVRTVGVPAGSPVRLQVRVWDSADGATFAEVQAKGKLWGQSDTFTVLAGDPAGPVRAANPTAMSGLKSFSVRVCLGYGVTIVTQPTDQRFVAGTTASLKIEATAGPFSPGYRWQRLDIRGDWQDVLGGNQAALTFVNPQGPEQGIYRVVLTGDCCGPITSTPAKLIIVVPPKFVNINWGDRGFSFDLLGNPENIYSIEVSSNLATWSIWKTMTNSGAVLPVNDTDTISAMRYFRVIVR